MSDTREDPAIRALRAVPPGTREVSIDVPWSKYPKPASPLGGNRGFRERNGIWALPDLMLKAHEALIALPGSYGEYGEVRLVKASNGPGAVTTLVFELGPPAGSD